MYIFLFTPLFELHIFLYQIHPILVLCAFSGLVHTTRIRILLSAVPVHVHGVVCVSFTRQCAAVRYQYGSRQLDQYRSYPTFRGHGHHGRAAASLGVHLLSLPRNGGDVHSERSGQFPDSPGRPQTAKYVCGECAGRGELGLGNHREGGEHRGTGGSSK